MFGIAYLRFEKRLSKSLSHIIDGIGDIFVLNVYTLTVLYISVGFIVKPLIHGYHVSVSIYKIKEYINYIFKCISLV
jgi:hypothetical protein